MGKLVLPELIEEIRTTLHVVSRCGILTNVFIHIVDIESKLF